MPGKCWTYIFIGEKERKSDLLNNHHQNAHGLAVIDHFSYQHLNRQQSPESTKSEVPITDRSVYIDRAPHTAPHPSHMQNLRSVPHPKHNEETQSLFYTEDS